MDELTVDPDSLRTMSRDLASVSYRISGLSQQVGAVTDRADLSGALAAALIPAALHSACASWAAVLASYAAQVMELSLTSNTLADGFENADQDVGAALKTIDENVISPTSTSRTAPDDGGN